MSTPAQQFEADWNREQGELRGYFLGRGLTSTDADDCLQDVAIKLWKRYSDQEIPENVSGYAKKISQRVLYDLFKYRSRWPRLVLQPPEYFENQTIPFADVWGREVASTRWDLAEDSSLAPIRLAETIDVLELLSLKDRLIVYYLFQDLSFREISTLVGLPLSVVRHRIRRIDEALERKSWLTTRRSRIVDPRTPPSWFVSPLSIPEPVSIAKPNAAIYLRKLPGYVPEWNVWFSRLTAHTADTNEPITFGIVEQLARSTGALSEDQGKRFLLAAMSDRGGLLTQKFFQIMPRGEPRLLSFSDISQRLRKESFVVDTEWMDQIVTAWEPTSRWRELAAW